MYARVALRQSETRMTSHEACVSKVRFECMRGTGAGIDDKTRETSASVLNLQKKDPDMREILSGLTGCIKLMISSSEELICACCKSFKEKSLPDTRSTYRLRCRVVLLE